MTARIRRAFLAVLFGLAILTGEMSPGRADPAESDAYAWLQYAADGKVHLRVIPSDRAACPNATADGRGVTLALTVIAAAGFDRVLCDAALPSATRLVKSDPLPLPPVSNRITRFIVLGDTGCRIERAREPQNCNDPSAWPFARIAAAIAREVPRPDLIVHVGDYVYRDAPCPVGDAGCAGSPYGDNWRTWAVDFFEPGASLFATAPLVFVRGNHDGCGRDGLGWSRYLAPDPQAVCRERDPLAITAVGDVVFFNTDSAEGDENDPAPDAFERDLRLADADAGAAGGQAFMLTHRPPLAYLAALPAADSAGRHLVAIVAGHLHVFAAVTFAAGPPLIVVGNGGAALAGDARERIGTAVVGATEDARFGYAVFDRAAGGWSISERGPDGSEQRRCELRARTVHC